MRTFGTCLRALADVHRPEGVVLATNAPSSKVSIDQPPPFFVGLPKSIDVYRRLDGGSWVPPRWQRPPSSRLNRSCLCLRGRT
jgi:hypothetical protein